MKQLFNFRGTNKKFLLLILSLTLILPSLGIFNASIQTGMIEYALVAATWFAVSMSLLELISDRNIKLAVLAHLCGGLLLFFVAMVQIRSLAYLPLCLLLMGCAGWLYRRSWVTAEAR
ncbi:MAG: hypothetical protein HXX08_16115 [Chloroflexi bacterium]|uniref:Uncharacterized protein n=1 Tax=Candidatus Chlorohelix allophototropha TaxID=3003348 RepID=A0A8T7M5M8_9CHLR|nr:hypothetical protein [Chloroflexota bacterium]WJW69296.1 hypothetical protein OZ401_002904 [Chloroflexota bacterium L227-S17]